MRDRRSDIGDRRSAVAAFAAGRRPVRSRRLRAAAVAALLCVPLTAATGTGHAATRTGHAATGTGTGHAATGTAGARAATGQARAAWAARHGGGRVLPSLRRDLVAYYDFEHPARGNPAVERDQGFSGTDIDLINGGGAMRVRDRADPGGGHAIQVKQVDPAAAGNDDWKAGVYATGGVPSLRAFNHTKAASIMGWVKMTGTNPSPNTNTADPDDRYDAIGLLGVLTGDSDGHYVRALLEIIDVSGQLRVVALGRRVDGGSSQTFAADEPWQDILPRDTWVFLAATFDYDTGTMRLYKNGRPLAGFSTLQGDPWAVEGPPEPDYTSATDPRGIKIGGSFPQNTRERNPCDCRLDGLMFLDRAVSAKEVWRQYRLAVRHGH